MDKRTFLKTTSLLSLAPLGSLANAFGGSPISKVQVSDDENVPRPADFWGNIRNGYELTPDYINLENGYYCIQPKEILQKYIEHIKQVNMEGAHYMRTVQFENKAAAVKKLAAIVGCPDDQLVITRNTTESLDLIISGQDWKPGDEAVMAEQDYGAMLDMFKQVSKRYGTVNKIVSIPQDPKSDDEIVNLYARAITPKTKLLMVCHMVNITGHILPVRKICEMAHKKKVKVMVDGAHAVAHIQFRIDELGCDYYGASLHKWLSVPLGAGMLYVDKKHIPDTWPLFADESKKKDDIARLNHTGTIPVATDLTIADAIDYYLKKMGAKQKEDRLRYLHQYWVEQAKKYNHLKFNTPTDPSRYCAIANVGVMGMQPASMAKLLLDRYKIYTVAIDSAGVQGCRITPNVYTTTDELDAFVHALKEMKV